MPNLSPVPDCPENLKIQQEIIDQDAAVAVLPYASITIGERGEELSDMEALAPHVVAFSDDGKGGQSDELMEEAMTRAKSLGKLIVAHCEVNELLRGGYIHDGAYAKAHGHAGICSESEWRQIERDAALAKKTGCAYHVCHISTKESVEIIRRAKAEGVNITCETAPHYLLLTEDDLQEDGRFKMNPPIRSAADRDALMEGILDGTIDMIATDHAPHSAEEKSGGLKGSAFGIVGLETAFPLLYTGLVKTGILSLEKLVQLITDNPRKRFGITTDPGYTVWDLDAEYTIDPKDFLSKGKATPFTGARVSGRCIETVYNNETVWKYEE
jgi:dihydroorotase